MDVSGRIIRKVGPIIGIDVVDWDERGRDYGIVGHGMKLYGMGWEYNRTEWDGMKWDGIKRCWIG